MRISSFVRARSRFPGYNPAVDHDPISAEHSVYSATRNARPEKYSRNKMAVWKRDAEILPWNMDLIYSPRCAHGEI